MKSQPQNARRFRLISDVFPTALNKMRCRFFISSALVRLICSSTENAKNKSTSEIRYQSNARPFSIHGIRFYVNDTTFCYKQTTEHDNILLIAWMATISQWSVFRVAYGLPHKGWNSKNGPPLYNVMIKIQRGRTHMESNPGYTVQNRMHYPSTHRFSCSLLNRD